MARKFVSGVLAFAMVFGATAPVVFAEPVATEVVDQEANYMPSLEKTEVTMKAGEVNIIKVNDIGSDANIADVAQGGVTVQYLKSSKSLLVTCSDTFAATQEIELTISKGNTTDNYGAEKLKLKVKKATAQSDIKDWTSKVSVVAGKTVTKTLVYNDKDETAPSKVTYRLSNLAKEYVSVSVEDKIVNGEKKGVNVKFTGLKAIPDTGVDKSKVTVELTIDGTVKTVTVDVTKADSVAALTVKSSATKTSVAANLNNADGGVKVVAQAYNLNEYGDLVKGDDTDNGKLEWSINGKGTELKNAKGTATIAKLFDDEPGIKVFKATEAGTYTITVSDAAGTHSTPVEITVTDTTKPDAAQKGYVATSATDITKGDQFKTVKPGATVDLSGLPYVAYTAANAQNPAYMSKFSGWTVRYVPTSMTYVASYDATTGKIVLVDENDPDLKRALSEGTKTASVGVAVTFTNSSNETVTIDYTINVTKAGAEAASITVTDGANFKAIAGKGNDKDAVENKTSYVMPAGTTVEFSAVAKDKNGFTDVSQDMIWYVENTNSNDTTTKPETIAVNNGGKLTALTENAGKVSFVGVSASNPKLKVYIQLYITAAKPTATPTATATPAPTATTAPTATAEPTKAPETKTGKVTASSLRVRETPVDGTVVGKLAKGTEVTITEEKDGWYKVTAGSLTGWVSGEYVELTTPSTNETATTTANLRLRKTAPSGSVLATMPKGAKVEVLEKGSDWSKVKYNGKTGYASNAYLEFEEDAVG